MSYNIDYSDNSKTPISIEDKTIDETTSLDLIGKDYSKGYGQIIAQNFLHLLENFASSETPKNPTVGQLWFDTNQNLLKVYTVTSMWKSIGTVNTSTSNPPETGETNAGDLWVNSSAKEVYVNFGDSWNLIYKEEERNSQVVSKVRKDASNNDHITFEVEVKIDDFPDSESKTVAIFSSDETPWVPLSTTSSPELLSDGSLMFEVYPVIYPGINIYNRNISEVTVSSQDPDTSNEYVKSGDLWVNTETMQYWVYANSSWMKLSNTNSETKMIARQRTDTDGINHVTFETIVDGKIIFIDSADENSYVLDDSELDEDGNPLVDTFFESITTGRNAIPKRGQLISYVPTGAVQTFAMQTAPDGWLPCDGREISRTDYERLFEIIGTTFGNGDGSSTFNVPDLRGEFIRGWDDGRGVDDGRSFGSSQNDEFKEHRHASGLPERDGGSFYGTFETDFAGKDPVQNRDAGGTTSQSPWTSYAGGDETRPRNIALSYCIKT